MSGLYYLDNVGETQKIADDIVYSSAAEEGVYKAITFEYDGDSYSFSFTWNESAATDYAAGQRVMAVSYPYEKYNNVFTIAYAVPA